MYVQLVLNVLIGFFTVRIILNALGEVDYGIYDLIGGIVGLLSFISESLSQSSMRFISVSLGTGSINNTNHVFVSCVWLHLLIALLLCGLLEFVGMFLFTGFLNIPAERVPVAKIIYHCMVLSLFVKINSTPLSALVCSYERFGYKATVSITESILKLLLALFVASYENDKLLIYSVLMVVITIIDYSLFFFYSKLKFPSVSRMHMPVRGCFSEVGQFAGWTLLDTFSSVVNRQGYSVLLNKFFGPTINSAFSVSRQLEGHIYSVSAAVVNSIKPQILKSHGAGDEQRMFRLSLTAGKFGFFMMSIITIPLLIMMPDLLHIWLNKVPNYTVSFSRLLIVACMVEQLTRGLVYANQAVGNIKWFSIIVSSLRMIALPLSWVVLLFGFSPKSAIIVFVICETIGSLSRAVVLSLISSFKISRFFKDVLAQVIAPVTLSYFICYEVYSIKSGFSWMLFAGVICIATLCITVWLIGLTHEEKQFVLSLLPTKKQTT